MERWTQKRKVFRNIDAFPQAANKVSSFSILGRKHFESNKPVGLKLRLEENDKRIYDLESGNLSGFQVDALSLHLRR